MEVKPRNVFENLVMQAYESHFQACPPAMDLKLARERNRKPKESSLPWRLVMRLSDQERDALKGLTSDMTQDRQL